MNRPTDPAELEGCCRASDKEDCTRPPCPCNLSAYSPDEIRALSNDSRDAMLRRRKGAA